MNWRKGASAFLLASVLIALAILSQQGWLDRFTDQLWLGDFLTQHPLLGPVALFLFGTMFTALGGPRQLIAALFGFAFGATIGTMLGVLATSLGAALCFLVARDLIGDRLQGRFPARLLRLSSRLQAQTFWATLSIRLLPVGSNLLTNLLAGLLKVRPLPFLLASGIGYLPQTLIFALAGSGLGRANEAELLLSALLGLLSVLIAAVVLRRKPVATMAHTVEHAH
jgi:uncharacterized membrane protein YdjX (TVP38/TMEM64 family)